VIEILRPVEGFGVEEAVADGNFLDFDCLVRRLHVVVFVVAQE